MSDLKIQGPVDIELKVHITDGTRDGVATIGMGIGQYPNAEALRERLQRFAREEMPNGFRLMTKREFFDTAVLPPRTVEEDGEVYTQRWALPGGDDYDE